MPNTNGLLECPAVCATGALSSNYYVRKGDIIGTTPIGPKITATFDPHTTATLITGANYTIPKDGYYAYTAQITINNITGIAANDTFYIAADVVGGFLSALDGTSMLHPVVSAGITNTMSIVQSGMILDKLAAGDVIQWFQLKNGSFNFATGGGVIEVRFYLMGETQNI